MTKLIDRNGAEIDVAVDVLPFVPFVKVYKSAPQSIANNVIVAVTFDTEESDLQLLHDTVINNDRITITTPGLYLVHAVASWVSGAGTTRLVRIKKNGVVVENDTRPPTTGGNTTIQHVWAELQLVAGDYLQLEALQDSGGALNLADTTVGTKFAATYVGQAYQVVRQKPVIWQGTPGSMPAGPFTRYDALELTVPDLLEPTKSVVWEFVYRDDLSATLPWHFKGGSAIFGPAGTLTALGTGYTDITGNNMTMPRPGDYEGTTWAQIYESTLAGSQLHAQTYVVSGGGTMYYSDIDLTAAGSSSNASQKGIQASSHWTLRGATAATIVRVHAFANPASGANGNANMRYLPIRIG